MAATGLSNNDGRDAFHGIVHMFLASAVTYPPIELLSSWTQGCETGWLDQM